MSDEKHGDPSQKLVMIVDDDDNIRELLEYIVDAEGFRHCSASDGAEALKKIQESLPDLVILDLMLPKYGGFDVLRQLQSGKAANIPIIVITGRYNERSTCEMIRQESNVMDFLEKPLQTQLLAMNLHKILRTKSKK